MGKWRILMHRVISMLLAIICIYAILSANTDEVEAKSKNDYNAKLTESSVKEGLGIPLNATVTITYGNKFYVEAYEEYLVSVSVTGTGKYEGYFASATFTPDDGYIFGNILMWDWDENIISNKFKSGKYIFYFTKNSNDNTYYLIRTDKNGKNQEVIVKIKDGDEYTIDSYNSGNLYFSDTDAFYKCNIKKEKITKIADCPFDKKLTNEVYLLSPSSYMGEWGPYCIMIYNIKTGKVKKISDYCLSYRIEGKNIYLVTTDKDFKFEHKNKTKIVRFNYKSNKSVVLKKTNKVYLPQRVTSNYVAYYDTNNTEKILAFDKPISTLSNGKYKGKHNSNLGNNGSGFLKAKIKDGYLYLYGSLTKDGKDIKDRYYRIKLDKNVKIEYSVDIGTEQGSIELFNNVFGEIGGLEYEAIFTIKNNKVTRILMVS